MKKYESQIETPALDVGPPFVSPRNNSTELEAPPAEGSNEYWANLVEALAVRVYVEAGEWPSWFMRKHGLPETFETLPEWLQQAILPDDVRTKAGQEKHEADLKAKNEELDDGSCFIDIYPCGGPPTDYKDYNLGKLAGELVKMDHWIDLLLIIETNLREEGFKLKPEYDNQVDVDAIDFVETIDCVAYAASHIAAKFNECFDAKYAHLELRPTAKVAKVLGIEDQETVDGLKDVLQSYPHPGHYAYPAGHGTDAGATFAAVVDRWELTPEKIEEVKVGCLAFAHFRTFSFMHTSNENAEGFYLGAM